MPDVSQYAPPPTGEVMDADAMARQAAALEQRQRVLDGHCLLCQDSLMCIPTLAYSGQHVPCVGCPAGRELWATVFINELRPAMPPIPYLIFCKEHGPR